MRLLVAYGFDVTRNLLSDGDGIVSSPPPPPPLFFYRLSSVCPTRDGYITHAHPGKDKLGSSLSMNGDTLAAGGIGYNSSAGVVYMFTASRSGVFQADQRIEHPEQVRLNLGCRVRPPRLTHGFIALLRPFVK